MNLKKLGIDQVDLKDKRVFLRVDFNIQMVNGKLANINRIVTAADTTNFALDHGAKSVVLASHIGRPEGHKIEKYSMRRIIHEFEKVLNKPVIFVDDCVGEATEAICENPAPGTVILLENVRFHIEEEGKGLDPDGHKVKASQEAIKEFRESLRRLADIYVNDSFGTSHRGHSSMLGEGFELKVAGLSLKKELTFFAKALDQPERPLLAILGGSKFIEKIVLLQNLLAKVNDMIISGGMAFTFLKTQANMKIGRSIYDPEGAKAVTEILRMADKSMVRIHLPVDFITGDSFSNDAVLESATIETGIKDGWMGLDVGPATRQRFGEIISNAKVIIWNGPPGVFEFSNFSEGTKAMMDAIVEATNKGATSILGGGDTTAVCAKLKAEHLVSHVSKGGGASIELLEGKELPGIAFLTDE